MGRDTSLGLRRKEVGGGGGILNPILQSFMKPTMDYVIRSYEINEGVGCRVHTFQ